MQENVKILVIYRSALLLVLFLGVRTIAIGRYNTAKWDYAAVMSIGPILWRYGYEPVARMLEDSRIFEVYIR